MDSQIIIIIIIIIITVIIIIIIIINKNKKVNHLFYMDYLKMYFKNDEQQEGLLTTVKKFSDDIKMSLD